MARVKPITSTQPLVFKTKTCMAKNMQPTSTKGRALHTYWVLSKRVEEYEQKYLTACALGACSETTVRARRACIRAQEDFDRFRSICKKKYPERMEFYSIDEIEMKNKYRQY